MAEIRNRNPMICTLVRFDTYLPKVQGAQFSAASGSNVLNKRRIWKALVAAAAAKSYPLLRRPLHGFWESPGIPPGSYDIGKSPDAARFRADAPAIHLSGKL